MYKAKSFFRRKAKGNIHVLNKLLFIFAEYKIKKPINILFNDK